jgi:hypothetical protein
MPTERDPADVVAVDERGVFDFWCIGCREHHRITTQSSNPNGARWTWNGDKVKPTISPSIHCLPVPEIGVKRCHSFIRDGQIQYLTDCEHHLAGQTVPLLTEEQVHQVIYPQ